MRILVTKTGNTELKELITEPNETRIEKRTKYVDNDISDNSIHNWNNFIMDSEIKEKIKISNTELPKISINNMNKLKINSKGKVNFNLDINKNKMIKNNSKYNSNLETNIEFTSKINLKQKKINLPKIIMEKYNTEIRTTKFNNDGNQEENLEDILFLYDSTENIPLKEIINIKALYNLRINTLSECKLKLFQKSNDIFSNNKVETEKNIKISKNLRKKVFSDEEINKDYRIEKLNKDLDFCLPRKYFEFITYIFKKNDVSREFISKVSSLDNNRLDHWNRVCLLYNQKNENKNINFKNFDVIDGIIKSKTEKDNTDLKNGLKYIRESLKTSKFYVDKNKNFSTKHRRLNEMMEDMKLLWKELGVDRLSQKTKKKDDL